MALPPVSVGLLETNTDRSAIPRVLKAVRDQTESRLAAAELVLSARNMLADVHAMTIAALPACTRSGNILTADANGALTIDGVAVVQGNRYAINNQVTTANNGLYLATDEGDSGNPFVLTRTTDADTAAEFTATMTFYVQAGTVNGGKFFELATTPPTVLNTDTIRFQLYATGIAQESATVSATASLTTRVSTEESTRGSVVTSLTTRVSVEESTRGSADTSLTTRVSSEESSRTSGDLSLTTRVSTEESTRAAAVTSLTTRVSSEESSRTSGDLSLTTLLSTANSSIASLTTRISIEESTRASQVASLAV